MVGIISWHALINSSPWYQTATVVSDVDINKHSCTSVDESGKKYTSSCLMFNTTLYYLVDQGTYLVNINLSCDLEDEVCLNRKIKAITIWYNKSQPSHYKLKQPEKEDHSILIGTIFAFWLLMMTILHYY